MKKITFTQALFLFACLALRYDEINAMKRPVTEDNPYSCDILAYPCNQCYFISASQRGLKKHNCIHVTIKPYPCPFCDKSYACKSTLATHKSRHHKTTLTKINITAPRSHPCTLCNKSYDS